MGAERGIRGGKLGDGFRQQRVDTRSVCLGQTGSNRIWVYLTSCNLMERFLSGNNGMVIGREQRESQSLMNSVMAGWESRAAALQMSVVTTEPCFITSGFEPAHKWKGKLLWALEIESIFTVRHLPTLSLIQSQAHTLTNHDSAVSDQPSPKGFAPLLLPLCPAGGPTVKSSSWAKNFHQSHTVCLCVCMCS